MRSNAMASVIFNEASGPQAASTFCGEVEEACAAAGLRVQWLPLTRGALASARDQAVDRLIARAEGQLVVAGGDGTVNAVASACRRLRRPLGILPGGTFNYVARNLGLPEDLPSAARVIAQGEPRPIPAGEINGRLFLNNAGFGLYSHMIERRESDKRRFGRHRIVAFYSGLRSLSERHPIYDLQIETDGTVHSLRTTTLFFGVNALQLANYHVDAAKYVERGQLAVLSLRLDSRLDIARTAWAALRGRAEAAECLDATGASSVRVTTRRRRLKVAIDGEIVVLEAPLQVRVCPGALSVMMPAVGSGSELEIPVVRSSSAQMFEQDFGAKQY